MKYQPSFVIAEAPIAQPWPGSVDGARSLVERFRALRLRGTEGMGGGLPHMVAFTSLMSRQPKKLKRI